MSLSSSKIWLGLGMLFLTFITLVIALPLQSNVYEQIRFKSNADALNRQLLRDSTWQNWWPGKVEISGKEMILRQAGLTFKKREVFLNKIEFEVFFDSFSTSAAMTIIAGAEGNVVLGFHSIIELEHNPINRVKALLFSSKLKSAFHTILENQSKYFASVKNLYDLEIQETTVQFEFYATLTKTFSYEPSIREQYAMIEQVKKYIKKNNVTEKGAPMLNITKIGDKEYFTQVAIPTDKKLPSLDGVITKWMLKSGNILKAEVRGGHRSISEAKKNIENYVIDNHKNPVAISYESLITNRLEQPDSNKWITEVYFPVF